MASLGHESDSVVIDIDEGDYILQLDDEGNCLLERDNSDHEFELPEQQSESDTEQSGNDIDELEWIEIGAPEPDYVHNIPFLESVGPKHCPPKNSKPMDYFNLFFTVPFLTMLATETNKYSVNFFRNNACNISLHSRVKEWESTSVEEIRGFLAVIINMGLNKKSNIEAYWSKKSSQSMPWFSAMFPRNRFQLLLKFFHVSNINLPGPGQPNYDPTAKFSDIVDHANRVFRHHYKPHQQLSVDESLIGTKCRTTLLQYLPNKKHHQWGVKLWMLCDAVTNYCMGFSVYKGAKDLKEQQEIKKDGLAYVVVTRLLTSCNLLRKGYHIFMDNYFTNIPLAKYLYNLKTFITGTIRKNRKFLPKFILSRYGIGEKKYGRNGPLLCAGFREKMSSKNPVLLLSSYYEAIDEMLPKRKRDNEIPKPFIVREYNAYMGGVDVSDMMLYSYLDERKTIKVWKKVVFYIIGKMLLNCYILYKENVDIHFQPLSHYNFLVDVVEELGKEWQAFRDKRDANQEQSISFGIRKLPEKKERICSVCSTKDQRRRSRTVCVRCNKGLHHDCLQRHKC